MNKSHLLINEPSLQVLPSLAKAIGLEEAIILQQLHYWLNNSKSAGRVDAAGNKWVYNTYAEWQEDNFPFWSEDKIKRIFLKLEEQNVVISRQLDAKMRDMTKFYRIDYDVLCTMDGAILPPSNGSNLHDVKMNQRLPENTTNGDKSPSTLPDTKDLPIDWKLGHGLEVTAEDIARMEDNKRKDAAALISTGFGVSSMMAYALAYSFQVARNITIPESKVKGQRKAIKEMLEMNVTSKEVIEAVDELVKKNMTVVDLFSVSKTAIALANAPEKQYNPNEEFML